jgi:hypothetical protein
MQSAVRKLKEVTGCAVIQKFCDNYPNLTRLTLNGASFILSLDGVEFKDAANLTEVYMDGTQFFGGNVQHRHFWEEEPAN